MTLESQRKADLWKLVAASCSLGRFEKAEFQARTVDGRTAIEHPGLTDGPHIIPRWEFEEYVRGGYIQLTEPTFLAGSDMLLDEFRLAADLGEMLTNAPATRNHLTLEEEALLALLNQAWEKSREPFVQSERGGNRLFTLNHPGLAGGSYSVAHRVMSKLLVDEYVSFESSERPVWKGLFNVTSKGREWYESIGSRRFSNEAARERGQARTSISKPLFFIVYRHDHHFAVLAKNYLQNTLHLPEPILLEERAFSGRTVIEKLEEETATVDAALVLFSPDDEVLPRPESPNQVWRARQNVILELGYFLGKWKRTEGRVIVLWKKTKPLDLPSDFVGLGYIGTTSTIEEAGEQLRREIKTAFPNARFD